MRVFLFLIKIIMARTPSNMISLGSVAPDFNLIDVTSDSNFSLKENKGTVGTVIMFICNHCPYVVHYYDELVRLELDYGKNTNMVAISSNDIINYPQDSPEKMKELWNSLGLSFPYLFDDTQEIAKKYKAECTPEFYLFNSNKKLVYRGRMDDTSPGSNHLPSGIDLRSAIDNLQNNKPISDEQFPSMGCNIKWKAN